MNFELSQIAVSLAAYLAPVLPGVVWYEDPNQQGTQTPCAFLQQRYSTITLKQAGYYYQTIGIDLTYLEEYNLPNLQQLYEQAAGALDQVMETFPYQDGEETALLRTYDRSWSIDLDALHYKFESRVWVSLPQTVVPMQSMDYTEAIKDG